MEKIEKLIEEIDSLTVVELNDLVKAIEAHDEREQQCSSFPEIHSVFLRVMFVDSLRCISCLKRRSKSVRIILSEKEVEVKENL